MSDEAVHLPEGWKAFISREHKKVYYYHAETGKSVWVHPSLLKEAHAGNKEGPNNGTGLPRKQPPSATRGSLDSVESSTLSHKDLQKLNYANVNERQYNQEKTSRIANWAAEVSSSQSSASEKKMKSKRVKPSTKLDKPKELQPLPSIVKAKDKVKTSKKLNSRKETSDKVFTQAMKNVLKKKSQPNGCIKDSYIVALSNGKSKKNIIMDTYKGKKEVLSYSNEKLANPRNTSRPDKKLVPLKPLDSANIPRKRKNSVISVKSLSSVNSSSSTSKVKNERHLHNPFLDSVNSVPLSMETFSHLANNHPAITKPQSTGAPVQPQLMTNNQVTEFNGNTLPREIGMASIGLEGNNFNFDIAQVDIHQQLDTEESMEIDDAPELNRVIFKEIQEIRQEGIVHKPQVPTDACRDLPIYSDPLHIVVDTNILLAHLKFVSELKDYPIPGIGLPTLLIPWTVLQELDSLKDAVNRRHSGDSNEGKKQRLNMLARKAIKFVSNCLQQEHPRFKGESALEAATPIEGFQEESNDDSILHCALNLKKRAPDSHVVMLSNDRNLCNKSIVIGIKAFSQKDLLIGLRSLFQNGTVAVRKENFEEYYAQYRISEIIARRRKQADDLSCELQCILREGFSKIIEYEMRKAYDDTMWLQIIKIQPPWTLHDVFTLFERHWIAVFGMIVQRKLQQTIKDLKDLFWENEGLGNNLETVFKTLKCSLTIFEGFAVHSSYDDMVTKCMAAVRVLLSKCEEFIKEMSSNPALIGASYQAEVNPAALRSDAPTNPPYQNVLDTFDAIWRTVTHYSALIFHSLDFPSPLIKDLDPNHGKPSKDQALAYLFSMTPCLLHLIQMVQSILMVSEEALSASKEKVLSVLESIYRFKKEIMKQDCTIQPEELLQFCKDENNRCALVRGLSQLDRSYAMLQQCVDYHKCS